MTKEVDMKMRNKSLDEKYLMKKKSFEEASEDKNSNIFSEFTFKQEKEK